MSVPFRSSTPQVRYLRASLIDAMRAHPTAFVDALFAPVVGGTDTSSFAALAAPSLIPSTASVSSTSTSASSTSASASNSSVPVAPSDLFELLCEEPKFRALLLAPAPTASASAKGDKGSSTIQNSAASTIAARFANFAHHCVAINALSAPSPSSSSSSASSASSSTAGASTSPTPSAAAGNDAWTDSNPYQSASANSALRRRVNRLSPAEASARARWGCVLTRLVADPALAPVLLAVQQPQPPQLQQNQQNKQQQQQHQQQQSQKREQQQAQQHQSQKQTPASARRPLLVGALLEFLESEVAARPNGVPRVAAVDPLPHASSSLPPSASLSPSGRGNMNASNSPSSSSSSSSSSSPAFARAPMPLDASTDADEWDGFKTATASQAYASLHLPALALRTCLAQSAAIFGSDATMASAPAAAKSSSWFSSSSPTSPTLSSSVASSSSSVSDVLSMASPAVRALLAEYSAVPMSAPTLKAPSSSSSSSSSALSVTTTFDGVLPPLDWLAVRSAAPVAPVAFRTRADKTGASSSSSAFGLLSASSSPSLFDLNSNYALSALSASNDALDCPTTCAPNALVSLAGVAAFAGVGLAARVWLHNFHQRFAAGRSPLLAHLRLTYEEIELRKVWAAAVATGWVNGAFVGDS